MSSVFVLFVSSAHQAGKASVCRLMAVVPDVQIFVLLKI